MQDFRNWNLSNNASGSKNEKGGTITNTSESSSLTTVLTISPSNYVNSEFIIEADFNTSANLIFYKANYNGSVLNIPLVKGKNTIRALTEEELAEVFIITLNISPGTTINITQIAPYQGAIVGDGIDDYGQCVKDFSLPEDYTVVAMREMLSNINGCTLAKMTSLQHGAFLFENQGYSTYSYGSNTRVTLPKLFSYQTKSSYNGTTISSGDASDSDTYKLKLFHQPAQNTYNQEALYSCGVFNRTLTAEELALVEDCMYLELEYNTNILDNIEYYDILDARYRSNEEAEERNKWNGRLGKLHLTLNNYAYSQMSGWNGSENLKNWNISGGMASILGEYVAHITKISLSAQIYRTAAAGDSVRMKFRLKGMQPGFRFSIIECKNGSSLREMTFATKDMTIDYSGTVSNADANQIAFFLHASGNVYDLSSNPVTIELIPDYGGALVSDGVDDYAISDEVIDEEIGGMVMMAEKISDPTTNYGNVFSSSTGLGTSSGKEIAGLISKGSDTVVLGDPWTSLSKNDSATYGFARSPLAPNNKLMIANNKGNERGNAALYQLRLLKTQPSDIQLEVIKQQVLREHNDYIKEMG